VGGGGGLPVGDPPGVGDTRGVGDPPGGGVGVGVGLIWQPTRPGQGFGLQFGNGGG
jgi:hypothetical protein